MRPNHYYPHGRQFNPDDRSGGTNFGLTALAAIPESKRKNRKKEPALISDPASYEAEAFRSLRTAISFLGLHAEHKTILFTSANPKEGKSFCSLNYSVALTQTGLRTLLIDADIRRP